MITSVKLKPGVQSLKFDGKVVTNSNLTIKLYKVMVSRAPSIQNQFIVTETKETDGKDNKKAGKKSEV